MRRRSRSARAAAEPEPLSGGSRGSQINSFCISGGRRGRGARGRRVRAPGTRGGVRDAMALSVVLATVILASPAPAAPPGRMNHTGGRWDWLGGSQYLQKRNDLATPAGRCGAMTWIAHGQLYVPTLSDSVLQPVVF